MRPTTLLFALLLTTTAQAQWTLQDAHTTADLRGIDALPNGVAWASGSHGTVLRTEDAGFVWQLCAVPPDAQNLDFRAIQAFDNNTALVMSSGKGPLSRLYKTTDGCQTWQLLFTNPDPEGFWDALLFADRYSGLLLGDPVEGSFLLARVHNSPQGVYVDNLSRPANWKSIRDVQALAAEGRGAFAASNESLALPSGFWRPPDPSVGQPTKNCQGADMWFGTSGPKGARIYRHQLTAPQCGDSFVTAWVAASVPMAGESATAGVFAIADQDGTRLVAVGGDYAKPAATTGTAAYTHDSGKTWLPAQTPPHGYRSAVAWLRDVDTWITVGPNGTDISTDDGRNWRALRPSPTDPPDADSHFNALSLPYAVGPHGRIATLQPNRLQQPKP